MNLTNRSAKRIGWIGGLIIGPIALVILLWPQMNYLPPVKRDAVDAFISFPSGANVDVVRTEVADVIVKRLEPYLSGEKQPVLKNYYFFTGSRGGNLGVRIQDQSRILEMVDIVNNEILVGFPDVTAFAQQGNLFGNFGGNASIQINLQSADFRALNEAAIEAQLIINEVLPGANIRPNPDPQIVTPELRLIPNDRRIAEVGMSRAGVARAVRAFGDGLWMGEFFHEDGRIDIFLRSQEWTQPEYIERIPIVTPSGAVVPLGDLARIERGVGPNQIYRSDMRRTIALNINPPTNISLGEAVNLLETKAEARLYEILPPDSVISYGGDADSLKRAVRNLGGNFALATFLLFLVMAAMFKSISDALIVIITLPMAAVGGVLALWIANLFFPAPLDLLGMIGFIILLGLVVNNAILLVSETRSAEASGKTRAESVRQALSLRVRPIFMSTSTSLMGMLPLVLSPGAGSLIYKGLAIVIVGGMGVSTLFTLILLPCLLQQNFVPWRNRGQQHPTAKALTSAE